MIKLSNNHTEEVIPFITKHQYSITKSSELKRDGKPISLKTFNEETGLQIPDIRILLIVAYQHFNWAPVYWKYIKVLEKVPGLNSPEVLVAGYKEPVETLDWPGHYLIPYFSNYYITKEGRVWNRIRHTEVKASLAQHGYSTFRLTGDDDKTANYSKHRIVALAFRPYGADVQRLFVDHINGDRADDRIENLDWVTPTENRLRASSGRQEKLRSCQVVESRDIHTGEVITFATPGDMAKAYDVNMRTIYKWLNKSGRVYYSGLQCRFKSDEPWPENPYMGELDHPHAVMFQVVYPDGTEKLCSMREAARLVGMTYTSLQRAAREGRNVGANGLHYYRVISAHDEFHVQNY